MNALRSPACAEALLEYLQSRSGALVILFDAKGRILATNEQTAALLGPDVIARGRRAVFVDFSQGERPADSPLPASSAPPKAVTVSTAAGYPETFYVVEMPVGEDVLVIGERDHAELDQVRHELTAANRELNNFARQLHKGHATLERLNAEKNEFLGMAAHDLRTPINNVLNLAELLLDGAGPRLAPDQLDYLSTIRNLSESMMVLLNDLLDLTAIESGRLRLRPAGCDLVAVVDQAVRLTRMAADRKRITLRWTPPATPVSAVADTPKLVQAIANIISNAIKFSPPGAEVGIVLDTVADRWRLAVSDAGAGMSPEDRQRIFRPFTRLSAQPTDGEKSTGLGLAIVHRVITAHGGRVYPADAPAGTIGTRFVFEVPRSGPSA